MTKIIPISSIVCPVCDGDGSILEAFDASGHYTIDCPTCDGKGWVLEQDEETYEKP